MLTSTPTVLSVRFAEKGWIYTAADETYHSSRAHLRNGLVEQLEQAFELFPEDGGTSLELAGLRLFDTLFPQSRARQLFLRSLDQSSSRQTTLALRLSADEASRAWLELPWEYLFEAETSAYLLLGNVTLSRLVEPPMAGSPPRPLRRILWISPPISSNQSEESIRLEASPNAEVLLFTGRDINSLDLANKPVEILHLSANLLTNELGHISLDLGKKRLRLEDLYQKSLSPVPRLVFIEDTSGEHGGHLLARQALAFGSAAAVGFELAIDRAISRHFSRVFYRQLRQGDSPEAAVAKARRSVAAEHPGPAWGSPVLWLQEPETPLFLIEHAAQPDPDPGEGDRDAELDDDASPDTTDSADEDTTDSTENDGLLRRLALDSHARAALHIAVDYTRRRKPSKEGKARRLSSSALLLALADPHSLLSTDADVAFFRRCLQRPFRHQIEKDLTSLLAQWRQGDELDLTLPFDHQTDLPTLTLNAATILRRAERLARSSHGGPLGTRHLLASLFSNGPDNLRPAYAHRRLHRAGHSLEYLRHHLFDHLQQQWPGDNQNVWQQALVGPRPHLVSRFAADRPKGADRLFVEPYARALAAVVAAWETPQPLSIGIFGEWGSGKSFFMHLLNDAIHDLKGNTTRDAQGQRVFCRSIIQIDFNAWHYAESQIWASLVDHILRSLYRPLGEAKAQAKLQKLELIGIAQQEAEARLAAAQAALQQAEADKEKQLLGGEEIWRVEFWQSLPPELVPSEVRRSLETLQEAVGLKETLNTARLAYRQLSGIERARSGIRAIIAELWRHPKRPLLAAALVLIVLALLSQVDLASWFDSNWWQQRGHQIAAGLTVLVAFFAPIADIARRTWRQLTALRDWLQTHHRRLDDELRQKLRIHQENVQEAQRQVAQLEAERDAALRELEALRTPASFSRFLRQRLGDNTYSQHLGVISAVHNDFRTLSDLLLRHKEARRRASEDQLDNAEHHVDRIVLYIDDLDRCPSATVVQVLEAIHLLLAFDLFVVVVGVDVRWVAQSLADRYPQHLRAGGTKAAEPSEDEAPLLFQRRATPHDYLEKIFQIPFWLPPMGQQASRNLIRALTTLEPNLDPPAEDSTARQDLGTAGASQVTHGTLPTDASQPAIDPVAEEGARPCDGSQSVGNSQSVEAQDEALAKNAEPSSGPESDRTDPTSEAPPPGSEEPLSQLLSGVPNTVAAAQALHMEDGEILYMEALAGAVGRSPRRLKRFVNVYRILKASCTPGEALRFVRDDGRDGSYRAAMTLLALTTGAPSLAAALYRLLEQQDADADAGTWRDALRRYRRLQRAPKAEADAVHLAFDTYCNFAGQDRTLHDLQRWAPRVKRFTFRSGG